MSERLKVTLKQLSGLGKADVVETLDWGMGERIRIKAEQDRLKKELEEVNDTILGLLVLHDIQAAVGPKGTLSHKHGVNRTINKDKITNAMLLRRIDAEVINEVLEEGTTVSEYDTVEFRVAKE